MTTIPARLPNTATAEAPAVLMGYQQRWVADKSPLKVIEKSRRTGLTWGEAADDVLTAASNRSAGGQNVYYIAYNQDMTIEYIQACAMWARAFNHAASEIEEGFWEDDDADKNIKTFTIRFPASGFRIVALTSRPSNLRGRQGTIVIDEAAFHDQLDELLKAALAMLIWGGRVRVISTHNGVENPFNELVEDIRAGKRKGTVGFALTQLQRRLASSPQAIYTSLSRRRKKLEARLDELQLKARADVLRENLGEYVVKRQLDLPDDLDDAADELSAEEYEAVADQVVDQATAAETIPELQAEILILRELESAAASVVQSRSDRKWEEFSRLLQDEPEMRTADGRRRKIIVFTEHRDTLNYLLLRIRDTLGSEQAVVTIHGGINRDDRRKVQEAFRNDPDVLVLLATDAAGEGVNLQNANLMVNYDLPWNPNRMEQRFGRIHRIGQREVCHLWNLVAAQTREGEVFNCLLEKLAVSARPWAGGCSTCWVKPSTTFRSKTCSSTPSATAKSPKPAPAWSRSSARRWTPST